MQRTKRPDFFVIGWLVIEKKYHNDCYHKVVIGWPVIGKKYHNDCYHKVVIGWPVIEKKYQNKFYHCLVLKLVYILLLQILE